MQAKGTAINDDAGLETEADVFGRRAASVGALQRKSIESDPIYPDPIYPVNDDQRLEHEADVMGGRAIAGTDSGRIQRVAIAGGQVEKTCLNSPSSQAVAQCVMNKLAFGTWKTKTTADLTLVAFTGSLSDKKSTATSIVASRGTLQNVNQELDAAIDIYNLTPNKANLLAVLKKVEELDGAIYAQQDAYEGSVSASPYDRAYMGLLGELASQMEAVLLNLNNEADSLTGIARIGAGNAPELNKDEALRRKVKERKLNSTKKADLISAVPNEDTASKSELREGLTIDSALASGTFTSLSKHENAGVDVDFVTNHPINGYKHWDQKAMYLEGPTWDGRVEHTHAKDVEDNGKKTGILLDTTYATGKDYERGWLALNKSILSGKLDPKAIKETKLANATTTTKDILFDSTLKSQPKGDDNLINLKLLHKDIKDAGFITQQIAVDLNGLLAQVQTKVDSRAFTAYRNHRGRLAAGNYIEINGIRFNDGQSGAKVRVVINTIIGHCYLTVTHYDPFTWQDSNAAQNSKSPFFELSALNGKITLPTE